MKERSFSSVSQAVEQYLEKINHFLSLCFSSSDDENDYKNVNQTNAILCNIQLK